MTDASDYIRTIQRRTGQVIGSPEMVAYQSGYITDIRLQELAAPLKKSGYGLYLSRPER